ncbi:ABC transporter ATP-binding protein [Syntrophomonas palmitatica]|uniref:ABC transporter ATP-binding protein n=1 Tax=Syntrophomonas palmitatica TaxID=402877 RepID=UPI0006D00343|nr:phosphate ABC transporter ATP-binding protein [Syntrophomonas palmitatica]
MNLYEIDNVSKVFRNRTVLSIDKLVLEQGRIYAILGPNGAGKTTLLRILNLLDRPDTGDIRFMGSLFTPGFRSWEISRRMCMVFQRPLMFKTTVYNNIAYGLKLRKYSRRQIDKTVRETLDFVGMTDFMHYPALKLSGGEMQRVALARALVTRPEVLLLDEPTANLDPHSVQIIEEIVRKHHEEYGTSVVVVTHNLFQARRMADEVILLVNGELVEQADAAIFFDNPRDERSRAFLDGTMVY